MSRTGWSRVALSLATLLLWIQAASLRGGVIPVMRYSVAGIVLGAALVWIFRGFASLSHTSSSVSKSAVAGLFVFTPFVAMLVGTPDSSESSRVVLALVAGAMAAMGGALWGVASLAEDAFADWRHQRVDQRHLRITGGIHR